MLLLELFLALILCGLYVAGGSNFNKPFFDDFSSGQGLLDNGWQVSMRQWGLVGRNHYPYLSANDKSDRRGFENNGVSPSNVYLRKNVSVSYPPHLAKQSRRKTVLALRANGDHTPPGHGYPAGINKRLKIDKYKDSSSFNGRWLIRPDKPQRVGATVSTESYFGPGSFEVGMRPLQSLGATTTIWAYHYNEYYPNTPDPLRVHPTESHHDPAFVRNCLLSAGDTPQAPAANCSCPLNSFPPHPWQQREMGERDHWWARNSEIDIEFPTPVSNEELSASHANMARFNTWRGQCPSQYTYSYQTIKTRDAKTGRVTDLPPSPGLHDGLFHVWRFDWYNRPHPSLGPTRVEFYMDGVLQRNVTYNGTAHGIPDADPRTRAADPRALLQLLPDRPMRLWLGVWFSYWGAASPDACLTRDDVTDSFSRPCAPWGSAADPERPHDPVWREALVDYVKITPRKEWGSALWEPELFASDGLSQEFPYAAPYHHPPFAATAPATRADQQKQQRLQSAVRRSGDVKRSLSASAMMTPTQRPVAADEVVVVDDRFDGRELNRSLWRRSRANWSPRSQTVWAQMCRGRDCKGSVLATRERVVVQAAGGFSPQNVQLSTGSSSSRGSGGGNSGGSSGRSNSKKVLVMRAQGDLYVGPVIGRDAIGGERQDGRKVGAAIASKQWYGPGRFTVTTRLAAAGGLLDEMWLRQGAQWEESSEEYGRHCGPQPRARMSVHSDCKARCEAGKGWPPRSGYWVEHNSIGMQWPSDAAAVYESGGAGGAQQQQQPVHGNAPDGPQRSTGRTVVRVAHVEVHAADASSSSTSAAGAGRGRVGEGGSGVRATRCGAHSPPYSCARFTHGVGICGSGSGVGSNGSRLEVGASEAMTAVVADILRAQRRIGGGGGSGAAAGAGVAGSSSGAEWVNVTLEWHTWRNSSCRRTVDWFVGGRHVWGSGCSESAQARVPATAMRLWLSLSVHASEERPAWWQTAHKLLRRVRVTQFRQEPVARTVDSFPYRDFAPADAVPPTACSLGDDVCQGSSDRLGST